MARSTPAASPSSGNREASSLPHASRNGQSSRTLPHNLEAEEGLLAACLMEGGAEVLNACIEARMKPESFHRAAHQTVFSALIDLHAAGKELDEIILAEELQRRQQFEPLGGYAFLEALTSRIDTPAHARYWLEIVREKYLLRRLIGASAHVMEQCYEQQGDLETFLGEVEKEILAIGQDRLSDVARPLSEPMDAATLLVEKMLQNKASLTGVPSGFTDLDTLTFGFHPQEMIVLAARPSMGKTTLALNIAEAAAMPRQRDAQSVPILFFSLEMSAESLAMRLLCAHSRVRMESIRHRTVTGQDQKELSSSAKMLKKAPIWIDDSGHLTILEMRAKARRLHTQNPLGMVIVDYLQLVAGTDPRVNREQQIAEISRGLKAMAKELGIPVLVLSQLNRQSETEKRQPRLSDLRESGSIEQDADVVLLLARRRAGEEGEDDKELAQAQRERDLIIAKQRNGPVGTVPLTFIPEITRFENYRKAV